jgi:hypothetical protein
MNSKQLISLSEFALLVEGLPPDDFEQYVLEVLELSGLFGPLHPNQILNKWEIDILTTTFVKSIIPPLQLPRCAIEVRRQPAPLSISEIGRLFEKWQDIKAEYPESSFILISTSGVSHAALERAQDGRMGIWDASDLFLFTLPETQLRYFDVPFQEYSPREFAEYKDVPMDDTTTEMGTYDCGA